MLPFQGLLLWSDLQKSLTDTGLTPSPARWDVQINPTLSVIALTCSLPYRIIIKRFCLLVKVFSFSAMSFPPVPSAFCLLIFYPCNRSRHKYQNHCDHSDKHHRPALFLLPVCRCASLFCSFCYCRFLYRLFIIQRYICLPYDLSFIGICNGSLIDGTILCFNFRLQI